MSDRQITFERDQVITVPARVAPAMDLRDSANDSVRIGLIVSVLFFVVLIGWAAIARLDAAAHGEGQVSVSGNRQTVQHREGGVVSALKVREGQHVKAGQVLIELAAADVAAQERALANSVIDLQAQQARLEAEINGTPIRWPAEFATMKGDDLQLVERAKQLQLRQLSARQSSLVATRSVVGQQAAEAARQEGGFAAQSEAARRQRESFQAQLESTRALADQGYVSRNSVRQIERAITQLEGSDADYSSRAAAAREQIAQMREQSIQMSRRYVEDSAALLRDTQFQLNELRPKWRAARDQLERTIIRAPVAGRVVGLQVFTVGGVISGGQPILDIVPDAAPLIVKAKFAPGDIDGVYEGREAEVKFLSLHERDLPILLGTVRNVSADSLRDEATGQSYYTAEIFVPESQLAMLRAVRGHDIGIRPGVPVQVFVKLRKRTALQYMLEPLTEAFSRSLHER